MKILLINPPVRDFYNTPARRYPLGLLYLAAAVRARGHHVDLLDGGASTRSRACDPPASTKKSLQAGLGFDCSPFRLFGRFSHFGPSFEEIQERVASLKPRVIGIASLFSPYAAEAEETARAAKRAAPQATVVLGGGHPSAFPAMALTESAIDYVVIGEGERSFAALCDALDRGNEVADVPGLAYRSQGRIHVNPPVFENDLDSLPLPARDLIDPQAYRVGRRRFTQILSSRGCPMACRFCSSHLTAGTAFRPRRPEKVVAEMQECISGDDVPVFDFEDDNLTIDRERALHLAGLIRETFGARRLRLDALNGLALKGLDRQVIEALAEAGFRRLHLAPLTTEPKTVAAMNRRDSLADFSRCVEDAIRSGLNVTAYLMVGYPGQTVREIMTALDTLSREPVRVCPSIFYPAAGSAVQRELMPELDVADSLAWGAMRSSCFPEIPGGFSLKTLRTLFWMARMADFAKSLGPAGDPAHLRSLCSTTAAATAINAPHPRNQPWIVQRPKPLPPRELGLEALGAYLRTQVPHGVRLLSRGSRNRGTKYSVYPLPGLIEERSFYRRWGIPGFDVKFEG